MKFARRHRALVAGALIATLSLFAAVAVTSWSLIRVTEARNTAVHNAEVAQQHALAAAIAAAQGAGESCRADAMYRHLASVPVEQRDIEWQALAAQIEDATMVMQAGCTTPQSLVVLRDQAVLFDVHTDRVMTMDLTTRQVLAGEPHPWHFANASASRDRSAYVVGGVEGRVAAYDGKDRRRRFDLQLASREKPAQCVAMSSDGKLVAAASSEVVYLLDGESGRIKAQLRGHKSYVWSAAFTSDDAWVATSEHDGETRIWDVASGKCKLTLSGDVLVRWVAFHPSGKLLATALRDGVLRLWSAETGALLAEQQTGASLIHACEFSADGSVLASIQSDGSVRLYSGVTLKNLGSLRGHANYVSGLAFCPDGQMTTIAWDGTLRMWDPKPKRRFERLEGMMGSTFRLALHPTEPVMAACSLGGEVAAWDLRDRSLVFARDLKAGMLHGVAWSADGKSLFTCGDNDKLYEVSAEDGLLRRSRVLAKGLRLRDVVWSAHLGKFVITAVSGELLLVDPASNEQPRVLALPVGDKGSLHVYASVARNSALAVSCELEGTLRMWDLNRGEVAWSIKGKRMTACAFSHDDSMVLAGDHFGAIAVIDARTGNELRRFGRDSESYHVRGIFAVDGGRRVLTSDQQLRIWDLQTGTELLALDTDRFGPSTLCADLPRGVLATGSGFFTDPAEVLVWPMATTLPSVGSGAAPTVR